MQVLLVEDHTDTRTVLGTLLNRCGCQTVTAKNLADARGRLKDMRFDVLISDLNLPDGDGIDLVREAKGVQQLTAIAARRTRSEPRACRRDSTSTSQNRSTSTSCGRRWENRSAQRHRGRRVK
jgi:CheY-like chemotaxis protein